MQSLSNSDERSLLDGVKMAVDLVDTQGYTPNAAMQKVAETFNYSPGFLKAACNAFNTGRQLAQWNDNENVLDKLASFPLADYDAVRQSLWNETTDKSAAAVVYPVEFSSAYEKVAQQELLDYDLGTFEKSAAAVELHPLVADELADRRTKQAFSQYEYACRTVEEARREKSAAENKLNLQLHLLESYFRKFAYDRLPLAQVEFAAKTYYGKPGAALMDYVAAQFPKEKRAADHQTTWQGFTAPVNRKAEPYTLIEAAIKQAKDLNDAEARLEAALAVKTAKEDIVRPFSQPRNSTQASSPAILTPCLIPGSSGEKSAETDLSKVPGLGPVYDLGKSLTGDRAARVEDQIKDMDTPEHLNELRKIKAQTVLTQLMSDPENPISAYDPEEVLSAYNSMVQLSPRLADQPAAVGPMLNKRLSGNTEPFEIAEAIKMEEELRKAQSQNNLLMKNEASIIS